MFARKTFTFTLVAASSIAAPYSALAQTAKPNIVVIMGDTPSPRWRLALVGVFDILGAICLRKEIGNEGLRIASGILSVAFGLFVFAFPGAGALSLAFLIAAFAIAYGILLVGFGLRLEKYAEVWI